MEVHVNQLPLNRNYVILNERYNSELMERFYKVSGNIMGGSRLSGIPRHVLSRLFRKGRTTIRLAVLLRIIELLNLNLDEVEHNIIWIGAVNSDGISNPRLPFRFDSRASARFVAAICNDGCITNGYRGIAKYGYGRIMYYNNEKSNRESVLHDAEYIFGSRIGKEFEKRNGLFLVFPSVIRDVVEVITNFKGEKSVNNPEVPRFTMENNELMLGWLEQTIADEGHVKYYPGTYRREIIWRRSFNKSLACYNLIEDEVSMLRKIKIKFDLKNIGGYTTKKGIDKVRLQIRISRKGNLLDLSKLIRIPDVKKQAVFEKMINSC